MDRMLEKYGYVPDRQQIERSLELIAGNLDQIVTKDVLRDCFSLMDLTTLRADDTEASVAKLVDKVTALREQYPSYPLPASICAYPNFAPLIAARRCSPELHVTAVAGCFPSSQSFPEVKARECELAVAGGADEVDIVLALNAFLAEDYARAGAEIALMRKAVGGAVLKVILETGLLVSMEKIAAASFLAMENGADFIKTSTGKVEVNATPIAAYVMCEAIRRFYEVTGKKVGFKAAGGISNDRDAAVYYAIVSSVLGKDWLGRDRFRFGVSRLGNSLMSAIEGETVVFF